MSHFAKDENLDKLKGAEQHHDLKNRPGEKGDPDHVRKSDEASLGVKPQTDDS